MTVDFICEVLAEMFDTPCNFSPCDEIMLDSGICERDCGDISEEECWKRYFELRWKGATHDRTGKKENV